jgi:hypothetical protein
MMEQTEVFYVHGSVHRFLSLSVSLSLSIYIYIYMISIQPLGRFWQEPEPNQATGMTLARCICIAIPLRHQMPSRPQQREHS